MRWIRKLQELIFPKRASTQTWMFLTLALLVTLSIACVALYVLFIHGSQVKDAARSAYTAQAIQIANIIDEAKTDSAQAQATAALSDAMQLSIVLARGDSVMWSSKPEMFESSVAPGEWPEVWQLLQSNGHSFVNRQTPSGGRRILLSMDLPASGVTVVVERLESPLHVEARRSRWTLLLGMIMALLMAMVSSWVMADKVTTPLLAIGRSAKDIIAGKLDTPIRVETRSAEIQDLAAHLDRMTVSNLEKIKELERLTRLQGEFIGNVSHEVRNPIFTISGYLEALGSPDLGGAKRKRFAANGLMNLARLGNLFESLIEIARLEYREDWIKPSRFNIAELMDEVTDMLRPKAAEKGITIHLAGDALFVQADRDRIRRVLVNLIDNAIVYSDHGTVYCRCVRQKDKARIEIVDQGRGISEVHQERIFERFFRVEPDRSRKSGGAGLGLSIVKQILQAHKERITIESQVGRGTRFWFELPYAGERAPSR